MKKDAKKIGVWGGTGSGKSTRVKELIAKNDRVIVFDPIGDYVHESGFKKYTTLRGLYKAIRDGWSGGFRLVYTVPRGNDHAAMLRELAEGLFIIQKPYYENKSAKPLTLVVEEMSLCYPQKTLGKAEQSFKDMVNLGRHYGIEVIGVSQRISEVSKNFVGNCTEHYFLRLGSAVDINAVTQIIGAQHRAEVTALQTHQYIHFAFGEAKQGRNAAKFNKRRR